MGKTKKKETMTLDEAVIDRIQNREELAIASDQIRIVVQAVRDELNLPFGTPLIRIGAEKKDDFKVTDSKITFVCEADRNDETLLALSHISGGIVVFGVDERAQPTDIERVADENAENSEGGQAELLNEVDDGDGPVRPTRKLAGRRNRDTV